MRAAAGIFGETEIDRRRREAEGRARERRQREKLERGREVMKKRGLFECTRVNQETAPANTSILEIDKSKVTTKREEIDGKDRERNRGGNKMVTVSTRATGESLKKVKNTKNIKLGGISKLDTLTNISTCRVADNPFVLEYGRSGRSPP